MNNEFKKDEKQYSYVYIVTYWDYLVPPVVTAFDNEKAADDFYEFANYHTGCCIDKVPIYSHFYFKTVDQEETPVYESNS